MAQQKQDTKKQDKPKSDASPKKQSDKKQEQGISLAEFRELQEQHKQTKEELEELREFAREVADIRRKSEYDKRKKDPNMLFMKVSMYDGKIVTSWSNMVTNRRIKTAAGTYIDDQTTTLEYLDGTKEPVKYDVWQRDRKMLLCLVKERRAKDGEEFVTLEPEEGGEAFEVNLKFVN